MTAMGRMRTAAPALLALVAALIAGCGSSQSGSASRTSPAATKTVTKTVTVTAARGSGSESSSASSSATGTAATGTGTGTGAMKSNTSRASICRAAGVKLIYLGGQGATGHGLLGFAIRNTGSAPCTTVGYPGIQFVSKGGAPLPTHPGPQPTTSSARPRMRR
jgi:hypothetical protein